MSQTSQKPIAVREISNASLHVGDITIVSFLDKEIDEEHRVQQIANYLAELVEEKGERKILLNFTGVEYLDEIGLGMLIAFRKKVDRTRSRLIMYGISDEVREKLLTAKLDKIFAITQDEQTALFEMTREAKDELSFDDQRKLACARYLEITPNLVSRVEPILDKNGYENGLRVIVDIHTGHLVNNWVDQQLEK
ncbi:MAG: STAS domain-containing protein [Patescibacteria group bacterium]